MRPLLVLSMVALCSTAIAQDTNDLDQAAALVFQAGTTEFEEGRFEAALDHYQTAYRLSGRPALLYNIALCHDRLEQKDEAIAFYDRFVRESPNHPAVRRASARLEILRESERRPRGDTDDTDDTDDPNDDDSASSPNRRGPALLLSVASASLISWGSAGLIARNRYRNADRACGRDCSNSRKRGIRRPSRTADVSLGVGVVAAVGGLVWLMVERRRSGVEVTPVASRRGAGVQARIAF
ncbi:MAG: tetratricopeptide repeat protein [Myxococcota bacterium]